MYICKRVILTFCFLSQFVFVFFFDLWTSPFLLTLSCSHPRHQHVAVKQGHFKATNLTTKIIIFFFQP